MINIMIKFNFTKGLATIFLTFPISLMAQCPTQSPNIDINVSMTPITYNYDYTSRQMQELEGQKNPNLLGLYSGKKNFNIKTNIETSSINGKISCVNVTQVLVSVNISPTIYISKESQQFECTKQRTVQHEQQHLQFEVNVASKAKPIIEQIIKKYYIGQSFPTNSELEIKKMSDYKSNSATNEIQYFLKKSTSNLHASIDSDENYKKESSYCSNQENVVINKLLQMKY